MEEANLAYPSSTELAQFGHDQKTGSITGPRSTMLGYQHGTDASGAGLRRSTRRSSLGAVQDLTVSPAATRP